LRKKIRNVASAAVDDAGGRVVGGRKDGVSDGGDEVEGGGASETMVEGFDVLFCGRESMWIWR